MAEPYRPSNGTEGHLFEADWCDKCRRGGAGQACSIHIRVMAYRIDEPEYPKEWTRDDDGPKCTAFSDKHAPRPAYRCKATPDFLGEA